MANKAVGLLTFNFGANMQGFDRAMNKAQKNMKKFGKSMAKTGKSLTVGLTLPLAGFGVAAVKAFDAQEKAIAQVEAGLKSTGGTVKLTSEQLQKMASDLQTNSIFGDEVILADVTAQLLTFTNITEEQFARTQQAALDLATRLDGDLKSSSIMLGKALNDPVANLSALSRAGIQFSDDQKETINTMVETNDLAGAQTLILEELEKQYGGSAKAASEAGMGPIQQLKNSFMDITEQIGERLLPIIQSVAVWIQGLAERFDGLSDTQKDYVVTLGLILAAIGPILLIGGKLMILFSHLVPVIKFAAAAFVTFNAVLAANPILAVVLGIGALVGAFVWLIRSSSETARKVRNFFSSMANGVITEINKMIDVINLVNPFDAIGKLDLFELEAKKVTEAVDDTADSVKNMQDEIDKLEDDFVWPPPDPVDPGGSDDGGKSALSKKSDDIKTVTSDIINLNSQLDKTNKLWKIEKATFVENLAEPFRGALGIMGDSIAVF